MILSIKALGNDERMVKHGRGEWSERPLNTRIGTIAVAKHISSHSNAKEILERLEREFNPILVARGFSVERLSELCCCFGGKLV